MLKLKIKLNQNRTELTMTSTMDDDWQSSKDTLCSKAAYLLQSGLMSDIHFIVGEGESQEKISAHRFILSMSSYVFARMFNSCLPIPNDEIRLPDVTPEALHAMLKFIYTDKVDVTSKIVMETIYAAKKYALTKLERSCEDFIIQRTTRNSVYYILSQAKSFDQLRLMQLCYNKIDASPVTSFESDSFLEVDLDLLCSVFERSSLRAHEKDIFRAAIRWSVAECKRKNLTADPTNQRAVLGKALFLIRFPIMSQTEFADGPVQSGVLTKDECVDIFLYFAASTKPQINFPTSRREPPKLTVNLFIQTKALKGGRKQYQKLFQDFRFSATRRIYLEGFSILTEGEFWSTACGDISVSLSGVVLWQHLKKPILKPHLVHHVMTKKGVEITANTEYTVAIGFMGSGNFSVGEVEQSQVVVSDGGGDVTFKFTNSYGNKYQTGSSRSKTYGTRSITGGVVSALLFNIPN